ncbi:MAG: energy transducer TonB [Rhodocyclaceae bacterium]|nr:energy transducer TonB [Rhodocyclaceae bacterium]
MIDVQCHDGTDSRVRMAGLALVLALHGLVLWGLWRHRLIPAPDEALTLFVNFIAPPAPQLVAPKPAPPKPHPVEKSPPRQLVAQTPVLAPSDYVAPPPPPAPIIEVPAPVMPLPAGPVALGTELSAACPERSAPAYPFLSRRNNEEGTVVLRVELSESGHVAAARVQSSSGHVRLDEAALTAVRTWRCTPAQRNGQPVRATALQPFKFVLQGN